MKLSRFRLSLMRLKNYQTVILRKHLDFYKQLTFTNVQINLIKLYHENLTSQAFKLSQPYRVLGREFTCKQEGYVGGSF